MYNPEMRLGYGDFDESSTIEVTVRIIGQRHQRGPTQQREMTWDNLTSPMYFLVKNDLLPFSESLEERIEVLLPQDKELAGTAGTAIDGVTHQGILDAWRSRQGDKRLVIIVHGDPSLLDAA